MRSNKSRSRNKNNNNNRNRSGGGGNNMNRVFDSSGPEGKVRGTPQQIIEKYAQLTQDAILSNDRVAAESFQQHGEHYTRLFAVSQKEIEAKRELHEQQQRERQQARNDQNRGDQNRNDQPRQDQNQAAPAPQAQQPQPADLAQSEQPDIMPPSLMPDTGLVDTPEAAPAKKPRARRKPKPVATESNEQPDAPKAAE